MAQDLVDYLSFRKKFQKVQKLKELNKRTQKFLRSNFDLYKIYLDMYLNDSFDESSFHQVLMCYNANCIYDSYRKKRSNIRKLLNYLNSNFNNKIYFCTFTFRDDCFIDHKEVKKLFKNNCEYYFCNEDFGNLNGRRHYHAFIVADSNQNLAYNHFLSFWSYGFIFIEKIDFRSDLGVQKLSKYILKLSQHSIKSSTRSCFMSKNLSCYYR